MLSISCPSHGSRVLLGTRRIRSLINTESGIVLVIECYCGTRVVLRTGRGCVDQRRGDRVRTAAVRYREAGEEVVDVSAKLAARVRLFDNGQNRKTTP